MKSLIEKISKLSKREQLILISATVLFAIFLVDRLIVIPVRSHLAETEEKIELRKKEIFKNEKTLNLKEKILPIEKEISSHIRMTGTEDQEVSAMLHTIEKIGSDSEVKFSSVKPRPITGEGSYKTLSADVEAECSMVKFFTFIYQLQSSPDLFRADNLKIRLHEKDPDLLRVTMVISRLVLHDEKK